MILHFEFKKSQIRINNVDIFSSPSGPIDLGFQPSKNQV